MGLRLNENIALFRLNDYLNQSDADECYLAFLSGTTKSIILSCLRYAEYVSSRWYLDDVHEIGQQFTEGQLDQIDGFVSTAFAEVLMSCSSQDFYDNVARIATAAEAMALCCQSAAAAGAAQNPASPHDGTVTVGGPGDQFPTETAYLSAKCAVSNAIYDTLYGLVTDIDASDIEQILSGVFGGPTAVFASKITNAGPLGWAISRVASAMVQLVFMLISVVIDFSNLEAALDEQHADLVCALYDSTSTDTARTAFMAELVLATSPPSASEQILMGTLLTNDLLNQLFNPRSDVMIYVSDDPIACSSCSGPALCDAVPSLVQGVLHGTGDYTKDSSERVLSSVYNPSFGLHYISVQVNAYNRFGENPCAALYVDCPDHQDFQLWVVSYSGYTYAGHSMNVLCEDGSSITPEIAGSGQPNPIGSWARSTGIEWASSTSWTMTCKLRDTP